MNDQPKKRNSPTFMKSMNCELCTLEIPRKSVRQRYCEPCSILKNKERQSKWAKEHPQKNKRNEDLETLINRGNEISTSVKRSMAWIADLDEDFNRLIRIAVPFSWSWSKNAIYTLNCQYKGHVALRREARAVRNDLTNRIKRAVKEQPFFRGKVWLDILVQKPNNKGDAVNIIDSVCDAVKEGIGIDDRYFSIRVLDWEIVKENPRLFVGISQSITEHHAVCSYCGRLIPETHLSSHKRTCKTCRFKGEFDAFMEKETKNKKI